MRFSVMFETGDIGFPFSKDSRRFSFAASSPLVARAFKRFVGLLCAGCVRVNVKTATGQQPAPAPPNNHPAVVGVAFAVTQKSYGLLVSSKPKLSFQVVMVEYGRSGRRDLPRWPLTVSIITCYRRLPGETRGSRYRAMAFVVGDDRQRRKYE
jgi:hypothetical protein